MQSNAGAFAPVVMQPKDGYKPVETGNYKEESQ